MWKRLYKYGGCCEVFDRIREVFWGREIDYLSVENGKCWYFTEKRLFGVKNSFKIIVGVNN